MGIPFNMRSGRAEATFPAFDPDSPDREILQAYEQICDLRNWARKHDDATGGKWADGEEHRYFADLGQAENRVRGTWAVTVPGVVAQLALLLHASSDDDGRAASILTKQGLLGLHRAEIFSDGASQEVLQAAIELLHCDWEQALGDYQRASAQYSGVVDLNDAVQAVEADTGETTALVALREKVEALEELCSDMPYIERLMKTLPYDEDEFATKVSILLKERVDGEALKWLGRDNAFLSGRRAGATSYINAAAVTPSPERRQPSEAIQAAFAQWRDAWLRLDTIKVDAEAAPVISAKTEAFRSVIAAPVRTGEDFMVKAYLELLESSGPALNGNTFEPDTHEFADERDNGEAYKRSLYTDLDRSDLGCCLLALGRVSFDANDWVDRAVATKLRITNLPEIQVGPADADDARVAREQDRLIRILSFDEGRRAEVAAVLLTRGLPAFEQAA